MFKRILSKLIEVWVKDLKINGNNYSEIYLASYPHIFKKHRRRRPNEFSNLCVRDVQPP